MICTIIMYRYCSKRENLSGYLSKNKTWYEKRKSKTTLFFKNLIDMQSVLENNTMMILSSQVRTILIRDLWDYVAQSNITGSRILTQEKETTRRNSSDHNFVQLIKWLKRIMILTNMVRKSYQRYIMLSKSLSAYYNKLENIELISKD